MPSTSQPGKNQPGKNQSPKNQPQKSQQPEPAQSYDPPALPDTFRAMARESLVKNQKNRPTPHRFHFPGANCFPVPLRRRSMDSGRAGHASSRYC